MLKDIKKNLLKDSLITTTGQIISVVLLFLSTAIIARFLVPEDLGKFFIIISVSALIEIIISLGLEPTLVKSITTADNSDKKDIFNRLLSLRIITQLTISAIYLVTCLSLINLLNEWYEYRYFILLLFNFSSLRNFFNAELQANKKFKTLVLIQLIQTILKVFAYLILGSINELTVINLLLIELISIGSGFIIQLHYLIKYVEFNLYLDFNYAKKIFKFAMPLYLNSFLHVFHARMNNFLIASFVNLQDVANYEISRKIPDGFSRLSASLTLVYYPFISELLFQKRTDEAEHLLNKYLKTLFSLLAPVFFIFFIFKEKIILIAFSSKYIYVSFATFLLLVIFLFSFVSSLMGYTLVAAGKPNYSFYTNLLRTVLSFILSIPLIYFWGYMGAIYSLFTSSILGFYISKYYLEKVNLKIKVWEILRSFLLVIVCISFIKFVDNYYLRSLSINLIIIFFLFLLYLLVESEFRGKIIQLWYILMKRLKHFF